MSNDLLSVSLPGGMPAELGLKRPTGEVFASLGFSQGSLRNSLEADGLQFSASFSPSGWCVAREGRLLGREAVSPNEMSLASSSAPVEVAAAMFALWAEVYGNRNPANELLRIGKEWLEYRNKVKSLIPGLPTLLVDREFFRHCLRFVEARHDWSVADYQIQLSQEKGQLRITVGETEVFCPAKGEWTGVMSVSAVALFRNLPKRFSREVVPLEILGKTLVLGGRVIPAEWSE